MHICTQMVDLDSYVHNFIIIILSCVHVLNGV